MTSDHRPLRFLVAESETEEQREARRRTAGASSAESFIATLRQLAPDACCDTVRPHETGDEARPAHALSDYHAVFLSGSPLHVYEDTPETRRQLEFMRAVFATGVPSFGSCAGLQVAVAAAGGTVGRAPRHEVAFARRIAPTEEGRGHPLLAGRPPSYDALAIHSDAVLTLPDGAVPLAGNAMCAVQAAEIRMGPGVFWGVQYHPELTMAEIAASMRRQSASVVEQGLARTEADVDHQATLLDQLDAEPDRLDLAWRLGVNEQITTTENRRRELANFIDAMVLRRGS